MDFNMVMVVLYIFLIYLFTFNLLVEILILRLVNFGLFKTFFLYQKFNFNYIVFKFLFSFLKKFFYYYYSRFISKFLVKRYWVEGDKAPIYFSYYFVYHSLINLLFICVFSDTSQFILNNLKYSLLDFDINFLKNFLFENLIIFIISFILICLYIVVNNKFFSNIPILTKSIFFHLGNEKKKNM